MFNSEDADLDKIQELNLSKSVSDSGWLNIKITENHFDQTKNVTEIYSRSSLSTKTCFFLEFKWTRLLN